VKCFYNDAWFITERIVKSGCRIAVTQSRNSVTYCLTGGNVMYLALRTAK